MSRGSFRLVVALSVTAVGALSVACCTHQTAAPPQLAASAAEEMLNDILVADWQRGLENDPIFASMSGDRRYNDRWPDRSLKHIEVQHAYMRDLLKRLEAIPVDQLSEGGRLNYALFKRQVEQSVAMQRFRGFLVPLNQRAGVQTLHELRESLPFERPQDYRDWLKRIEQLDTVVAQTQALMQQGIEEGRLPPRVTVSRVSKQLKAHLVDDPRESPFYARFSEKPEAWQDADWQALQKEAQTAIQDVVVPAYRRFSQFFEKTYLPHCRQDPALKSYPDGDAYYSALARRFTTTDLTPREIHDIGQAEVKRILKAMESVKERVGFEGDLQAFFAFMRSDPRFFFKEPQDLLDAYLSTSKRIDPELTRLFGRLPRTPYGVRPIPALSAPDTTTAYYMPPADDGSRAGYFYVNLYKPEVRPRWEIEVLTVHEAMPGHHLQIALAQELDNVPDFRRHAGFTAFVEGWGLYSESLGYDLGLYQDPYAEFGQLTYDMWRAVRLVVDTGIHHLGWSRQKAIDFFMAHAPRAEHDVVNEIDRYIAWPGQALAYKIGQLKIQELRQKAERELGDSFDIRAFHDTLLGEGALPLDLLEARMERFIDANRAPKVKAG